MLQKILLLITITITLQANSLGSFNLKTIDNQNIVIEVTNRGFEFPQYPNKSVYLNFFGTHCPPCRAEIPRLINEASDGDIQLISIQAQDNSISDSEVKSFVMDMGMHYPVINANQASKLINFLNINGKWLGGVPYTITFDSDGTLLGTK
jgi:thiol-disulfide isomerase/thioredoxin